MKKNITLVVSILWSACVFAEFSITNRMSDLDANVAAENAVLQAFNSAADNIQTAVNTGFLNQTLRQSFADGLAKANTSAAVGLIADRANDMPTVAVVGLGAQAGLFTEQDDITTTASNQLPQVGIGAQGNILVGIPFKRMGMKKLGFLNGERLMLFLSGFGYSTTISDVSFSFLNLGLNLQYQVLPSIGTSYLAKWGGLKILSGLNYATNRVEYSASLSQSSSVDAGGDPATVNVRMDYTVGASSSNFLIPFEVSSSVQLFYLFTVYGGAACDMNFGSSALIGTGSGPITTTYNGPITKNNLFSATASLNLDDGTTGNPSVFSPRGFVGAQLNFSVWKIGAEYTALTSGTKMVGAWTRVSL